MSTHVSSCCCRQLAAAATASSDGGLSASSSRAPRVPKVKGGAEGGPRPWLLSPATVAWYRVAGDRPVSSQLPDQFSPAQCTVLRYREDNS